MTMPGSIYLLRHGETIWNRARRLQGQKDTPLTLRGIRQAEAMGHSLRRELDGTTPTQFFASPLGRTRQTACIIADVIGQNSELIVHDDRLREITFGLWDGLNLEQLRTLHAETWSQRTRDRWRFVPPEGESYQIAARRIQGFLDDLPSERPVVIVAHGAHNRVLRGLWRGLEPEVFLALDEPQDGFYRLERNRAEVFVPA